MPRNHHPDHVDNVNHFYGLSSKEYDSLSRTGIGRPADPRWIDTFLAAYTYLAPSSMAIQTYRQAGVTYVSGKELTRAHKHAIFRDNGGGLLPHTSASMLIREVLVGGTAVDEGRATKAIDVPLSHFDAEPTKSGKAYVLKARIGDIAVTGCNTLIGTERHAFQSVLLGTNEAERAGGTITIGHVTHQGEFPTELLEEMLEYSQGQVPLNPIAPLDLGFRNSFHKTRTKDYHGGTD